MPPLRRSARLKRTKAASMLVVDGERFYTRQKKRREICPPHHIGSPSAKMALLSMASGVWSDDSKLQLEATTQLFNLVSVEDNPLIDELIQSGAVPRLVEFLMRDDYPQLQCEAARVLKNIASGTSENTKMVINCGAVPVFVKLLESSKFETLEQLNMQVAWALGNIAGDSPGCCDIILNCGALPPLLTLLHEHNILSFLRIGTWALSNFFEGKPDAPLEQLESAIPVLASLVLTNDEVVLKEACWALSYLSRYGGGIESAMYEADLCSRLSKLYEHAPPSVLFPAIRTITSIVSGTDTLDERALEARRRILYMVRNDLSSCILKEAHYLIRFLDNQRGEIIDVVMEKRRAAAK